MWEPETPSKADYEVYKEEWREYQRGYHDGKREGYTKMRDMALVLALFLIAFSIRTFFILYAFCALLTARQTFIDEAGEKLSKRLWEAFIAALIWPFALWKDALRNCHPRKT